MLYVQRSGLVFKTDHNMFQNPWGSRPTSSPHSSRKCHLFEDDQYLTTKCVRKWYRKVFVQPFKKKKQKIGTQTWSRRLKQIGNKRTPLKHPVLKHRAWHAVALSSTETDSPATPLRNRKGSADSIPKNWETRMATGYWWDVTGYQLGKNWDFLMGCLNNIFFSCQKQHEWILMGRWWDININVVGYQLSIGNEEVSRNIL